MGWLWRVIDDDQNPVREGEVVHSYVCVCAYDAVIILLIYDWY